MSKLKVLCLVSKDMRWRRTLLPLPFKRQAIRILPHFKPDLDLQPNPNPTASRYRLSAHRCINISPAAMVLTEFQCNHSTACQTVICTACSRRVPICRRHLCAALNVVTSAPGLSLALSSRRGAISGPDAAEPR